MKIINNKDRRACDRCLDVDIHGFWIAYCSIDGDMGLEEYGWKLSSAWPPTYVYRTNSKRVVRKTIKAGLKRVSRKAYKALK